MRPFIYYIGEEDSDDCVIVPLGYQTDFCSTPRFLWFIIPPDGQYAAASVVHDICYQKHLFSQKKSDEVFLEAMQVLGVSKWKRLAMFYGLRLFGFISYKKAGRKLKLFNPPSN